MHCLAPLQSHWASVTVLRGLFNIGGSREDFVFLPFSTTAAVPWTLAPSIFKCRGGCWVCSVAPLCCWLCFLPLSHLS